MSDTDLHDAPPLLQDPAALAGALGGDPMSLLMSQLGASNPQAAMMLRMIEERNRARATEHEQEERQEAEAAAAQRAQDLQELKETVERACAELDVLRTRHDALAAALGACHLCFGTDPLCQECHGRGIPGARAPEPTAFRTYVLPAIRRARAIDARRQQSHPPQHQPKQPAPDRQTGIQP